MKDLTSDIKYMAKRGTECITQLRAENKQLKDKNRVLLLERYEANRTVQNIEFLNSMPFEKEFYLRKENEELKAANDKLREDYEAIDKMLRELMEKNTSLTKEAHRGGILLTHEEHRQQRNELLQLRSENKKLKIKNRVLQQKHDKAIRDLANTEWVNDVRMVITHKGSPIYHYSKRGNGPVSTTVDLDDILNTTRRETRKEVMGELSEKLARKVKPIVYHDNLSDCGSCVDRKDLIELGLL